MSSVTNSLVLFALVAVLTIGSATAVFAADATLRVCADPNNLPFSNRTEQGFENHLANMIATDLRMRVSYYWFPQREAFFRKTLNAGLCDVVMEVPAQIEVAGTTVPYYRSSYVFVSRRNRHLKIKSMDDPRLRRLRIGVHVADEDEGDLPPVNALTTRGIVRNIVGYNIYGNLAEKNPPADLIRAVVRNDVDIAIAWGPMAGYFAKHSAVPLDVTPVDVVSPDPNIPFTFAISMGVRRGDRKLQMLLDSEIQRRKLEIRRILKSYGVPLLVMPPTTHRGD